MQSISFQNYLVDTVNLIEEESQGYDGVILLYLLKGSIDVQTGEQNVTLNTYDLLIVNQGERYRLTSQAENILVKVSISHRYFSRYYANYATASFNLDEQENNLYQKMLREVLTRLAISKLQSNKETGLLEINALLSNLLSLMVMHFKQSRPRSAEAQKMRLSGRIENTLSYLENNYHKPLSLSLLAKINHTTPAYFSRLFSREVGTSFKTYLTQLRFAYCVEALAKTDQPLYHIVEENGFTDTRNFTALFKARYHMTPNQYRTLYRSGKCPPHLLHEPPPQTQPATAPRFGRVHQTELLALLANSLSSNEQVTDTERLATKKLAIALPQSGLSTPALPQPGYIVHVGRLQELLQAHVQQQLKAARQKMPLRYAQVDDPTSDHSLPHLLPTDERCPSITRYAYADLAIEFLKQQGVALLISLSFPTTEEERGAGTARLLDFIAHCVTLFGEAYVSGWAFSLRPNLHFLAESERHFLTLRSKVKALLPRMQAGLFYPFPPDKEAIAQLPFFASESLKRCDFLGFAANANDAIRRDSFEKQDIADAEFFIQRQAQAILEQLKKNGLTTPLFLQTWNTLTGDTRHTNGSFFRGALLMNTLISLPPQIAAVGFWINSEAQQEAREDLRIDTSSLALFYIGNTRRPLFHVLCLRERLSGEIVASGENYLVTAQGNGYRVMLTNSVTFNPCLSLQNQFVEGFRLQLNVTLSGITPGIYQIKRHLFDQQHGALYHQFECQPTNFGRDSEVMQFIDQHAAPDLHLYDETIGSRWNVCVEMDVNAICLFEILRVG